MNVPPAVAADLQLLDEVLDGSLTDLAATLLRLMSEAELAVPSYLGLSVLVGRGVEAPLHLTTFRHPPGGQQIGTSLRFGVSGDPAASSEGLAVIELVLYAATPGALVDLVADLTWLTGRPPDEFHLDDFLAGPPQGSGSALASWSTVNQARGVLMGGGLTVAESDAELDARAASAGTGRHLAAAELLARLRPRPGGA